jgi:hypothetical protein
VSTKFSRDASAVPQDVKIWGEVDSDVLVPNRKKVSLKSGMQNGVIHKGIPRLAIIRLGLGSHRDSKDTRSKLDLWVGAGAALCFLKPKDGKHGNHEPIIMEDKHTC